MDQLRFELLNKKELSIVVGSDFVKSSIERKLLKNISSVFKRVVGGSGFFDAIEMFDDEAVDRLTHYAKVAPDRPVPGFWTEQDIANKFA